MRLLSSLMKNYKKIKFLYRHMKNPSTSFVDKLIIICTGIYVLSPIDLIVDPVFFIGLIDDVLIVSFVLSYLSEKLDKYAEVKTVKYKKSNLVEDVEYEVYERTRDSNEL